MADTTMTPIRGEIWRFPPLRTGQLLARTLRSVVDAAPRLWRLWLVWLAVNAVGVTCMIGLAVEGQPTPFASYVAFLVVVGAVWAVLTAACLPTFLALPRRAFRFDRRFGAYAIVTTGLLLLDGAPMSALANRAADNGATPEGLYFIWFWGEKLWWLILLWPLSRLALWPLIRLLGTTNNAAGFSWKAMRGGVAPYVVAYVALSAVPYLINEATWMGYWAHKNPLWLVPIVVVGTAWDIVLTALAATLYRARLGEAERVSDVFD